MAVRSANTIYEAATTLATLDLIESKQVKVLYIILTAVTTACSAFLKDFDTLDNKLYIANPTAGTTTTFDFSRKPLVFANGIKVDLEQARITVVIEAGNG